MEDSQFVTVGEAAKLAHLGKSTVYHLIHRGVLRRLRLPGCGRVLIPRAELERFIAEGVLAGAIAPSSPEPPAAA
jgi:excisionase family DNA binding protein